MIHPDSPAGRPAPSNTRNDLVRMEGRDAARKGAPSHDNPYRSRSADGIAWRAGYDAEASDLVVRSVEHPSLG